MKYQVYSSCCWVPSVKLLVYPGKKHEIWNGAICDKCKQKFKPTDSNIKAE